MSLNRVQLIGNLTREPEMRQIPGGQVVANFGIATNLTWTDQSGQKQNKAEFHNVIAWRKLAEICGQYLKKGSKVFIEGRLQTTSWEGEDGVKRYKTEIVADNMIMLDAKGGAIGGDREAGGLESSSGDFENADVQQNTPVSNEDGVTIEDLPF